MPAPDYSDLNPEVLRRGLVDGNGNLKPGLVTPEYTGGTPSAAGEIKASLRNADGTLKAGLIRGDQLKESISPD